MKQFADLKTSKQHLKKYLTDEGQIENLKNYEEINYSNEFVEYGIFVTDFGISKLEILNVEIVVSHILTINIPELYEDFLTVMNILIPQNE